MLRVLFCPVLHSYVQLWAFFCVWVRRDLSENHTEMNMAERGPVRRIDAVQGTCVTREQDRLLLQAKKSGGFVCLNTKLETACRVQEDKRRMGKEVCNIWKVMTG